MPVIVCGLNHKTAPVAMREQVVFTQDSLALYLQSLIDGGIAVEALLLSTCNRSEIYCDAGVSSAYLKQWFAEQHGLSVEELKDALYCHEGVAAVKHIMRVACGLDSMVLGESQILGQMKAAFTESCAAGTVGPLFNKLFQQVFSVAKDVRSNTDLGACPVSISAAAARFVASTWGGDISKANIMVVGAGLTVDLLLRHLRPIIPAQLVIVNRNKDNASVLAKQYSAHACSLVDMEDHLLNIDIIVTATASPSPILTAEMLHKRVVKPLLIVDIAVPRDVAVSVGCLPCVNLYSIDDLRPTLDQGMNIRQHAAQKAVEVIEHKSKQFMEWLESLELVTSTICAFRSSMESLCELELKRADKLLEKGEVPSEVLRVFARALTQKILHAPSVQLRQAGVDGRTEMLQLARELFAIPVCELDPV